MKKSAFTLFVLLSISALLMPSSLQVEKMVSTLMRLSGFTRPPGFKVLFVPSQEIERLFMEDFLRKIPDEELRSEERLLALIGLTDRKTRLIGQIEKLVKGNIKAHYHSPTQILYVDESVSFADDFSLGPVVTAIWKALIDGRKPRKTVRGGLFNDERWVETARIEGTAALVGLLYFGESSELLVSLEGSGVIDRVPFVSAAMGFDVEPIVKNFFSQTLIQGVEHAQWIFSKKKEWKGLKAYITGEADPLLDFFVLKPRPDLHEARRPPGEITLAQGFSRREKGDFGLIVSSFLLDMSPLRLYSEMGWRGDGFVVDSWGEGGSELLQWAMVWSNPDNARNAAIHLRDRYESWLGVRFVEGKRQERVFWAGRDSRGAYVLLRNETNRSWLVRSFDREVMNRYIDSTT